MSNLNFVIRLELKGEEEFEHLLSEIKKEHTTEVRIDDKYFKEGLSKMQGGFGEFRDKLIRGFSEIGFSLMGIRESFRLLGGAIGSFVGPAAEFESLRMRLENMYGSVEKAREAFDRFKEIASTTPFELRGVVEAGAILKAFGMDAEESLKSAADLAAFMGVDIVEAANAMGRAFAGGVGAADILRERGILNLIKSFKGIDDLSKLTLPEFREAMKETFESAGSGIAGSTDKLSKSYQGAISNMRDALTNLRAEIGSKLLPVLAEGARRITGFLNSLTESPIERTIKRLKELGGTAKEILELERYSKKMRLEEINRELKRRGIYYEKIGDIINRLRDNNSKLLEIERGKSAILEKRSLSEKEIYEILTRSGIELGKARDLAKGLSEEMKNGMSGKAMMDFMDALEKEEKQIGKYNKDLLENKDILIEREMIIKQLSESINKEDKKNKLGLVDKSEIKQAKEELDRFFNNIKSSREKLEEDYKHKQGLIAIVYGGDEEAYKKKLAELGEWYKRERDRIAEEEKREREAKEADEYRSRRAEYEREMKLLMAKKDLGINIAEELKRVEGNYLEWLKAMYGEDSEEYKRMKLEMGKINKRYHEQAIANYRAEHFVARELVDSIGAGFRSLWDSILDSSMTGRERMNAIWESMRGSFMNAVGSMLKLWIKKHIIMILMSKGSGKVARGEAIKTAAVERVSILKTIGLKLKSMMITLGEAVASGFKWLISTLGPFGLAAGIALGAGIIAAFNGIRKQLGFREGGLFRGVGGSKDDSNIIAISDGEYIVNAESTRHYLPLLNAINFGKSIVFPEAKIGYSGGGLVMGEGNKFIQELENIREELSGLREDVYKASPKLPRFQVIDPERLSELVEEGNIRREVF